MGSAIGHGKNARGMMTESWAKLIPKRISGTIASVTGRRTALDHKSGNNPMEEYPVVKGIVSDFAGSQIDPGTRTLGQADEIRDSHGCMDIV